MAKAETVDVLALLSVGLVLPLAEQLVEMSRNTDNAEMIIERGGFTAEQWLKCYRQNRRNFVSMFEPCAPIDWHKDGHRAVVVQVLRGLREANALGPEELERMSQQPPRQWPRFIRRYARLTQFLYKHFRPDLARTFTGAKSPTTELGPGEGDPDFDSPAGRELALRATFNATVFAMQYVQTGKPPGKLLRLARQGDGPAVEQLLQIDKRVLFDPQIKRRFEAECNNPKSNFRRHVVRGLSLKPKQLSQKFCKVRAAAIVSEFAKASKLLSVQKLRTIFDGLSANGIDTSLPQSMEAWEKAVNRSNKEWVQLTRPDKNKSGLVR